MANRKIIETMHKLTRHSNLYNINRSSDWTNQIVDLAIRSVLRKVDNRYRISFLLLSVNLSSIFLSLKKWSKSLLPFEISSIFLWSGSGKPSIVSTEYLPCTGIRSSTKSYNEISISLYHIIIQYYNFYYITFR